MICVCEEEYVYRGVDLWSFSHQSSAGNCLRNMEQVTSQGFLQH